ncbi:pyocin activator PrtN family protein [Idiomarina abyssalis]|uniref:pyocin activator PrtN family protein n=1 Tax=Idiomarina abyssalis TaxID=86102 RepID=UPI001CD49219|nr:pyocin activator PrtN family protein [Idiomarina abyssalis]
MKTLLLLLVRYERSPVPLSEICKEFFGIGEKQAAMMAASQALPVPAFKLRESERAGWMVDLRDLAEHIDKKRRQALNDYTEVRT